MDVEICFKHRPKRTVDQLKFSRQFKTDDKPYQPVLADDKFYILSDDGVLTVINASADRYDELSETKVLDGADSWGPIAIAGGLMLVRNSNKMICLDVRADAGRGNS